MTGRGDFSFTADFPVFHEDIGARSDLSVIVYNPELAWRQVKGRHAATVELSIKLARQGRVAVEQTEVFVLTEDDAAATFDPVQFQLLELPLRPGPGKWAVTLKLVDRVASSQTTLDGASVSIATGVLEVPRWEEGPILSDPEFRLGNPGAGLPNPERLFGVSQDTLSAYLELRDAKPGTSYPIEVEVLDPIYGGMGTQRWSLHATTERVASVYRLPLDTYPEGTYIVRFVPQWAPLMTYETQFSVSWRMDRVVQSGRDVMKEAALVFGSAELDRFAKLSRTAQSQSLQDFWDRLDPTPGTVSNETYDRFLQRVAYADRHYFAFGRSGSLTDRGRIYVKYGAPLDVRVEVIPLNGTDLEFAIGEVHNVYQVERSGIMAKDVHKLGHEGALEAISTEARRRQVGSGGQAGVDSETSNDQKRNFSSVGQEGGFEIWEYSFHGEPLLEADEVAWAESIHLRFLFVDRMGTGDYRLEFSNVPLKY